MMAELVVGGRRFRLGYRLTPVVKMLIISNVVMFVLSSVLMRFLNVDLWQIFGLVPARLFGEGMIWQPFTYLFLHGGVLHLLLNMLWLWTFGGEIEGEWGQKQFLAYYLLCGVAAGLIVSLFYFDSRIPGVGASGAVMGILIAYGLMYADRRILFVIFPMKVKHLVWIVAAINIWSSLGFSCGRFGAICHLGGAVAGFVYLKIVWRLQRTNCRIERPGAKDRFSKIEFGKKPPSSNSR